MTEQHAKYRPPSSAARWLSCPGSASITHLYESNPSAASLKGTLAHELLDMYLSFGLKPDTDDPDMDMNVIEAGDWAKELKAKYQDCELHVEQRLDIPQTGEFGTCDLIFVTPKLIHIADYKNGYVPVDVKMNAQMMVYLLGAIAKYGERKHYKITVIQPNYDHVDGTYRTVDVTPEEVAWFEQEVKYAVTQESFTPGEHCKKTYCPHRGNCASFMDWAQNNGSDAYYPHEVNALNDEQLATALDHADTLHGLRDELRKQAIKRIMQHGSDIRGYKCVKSRSQRDFAGDEGRTACYSALLEIGYTPADLIERTQIDAGFGPIYEQKALSVAGVERLVKQKFKHFGRGKWRKIWDDMFKPHVRDFSGSITLERAIDGRPAKGPGSEFDAIAPQQVSTSSENVTLI